MSNKSTAQSVFRWSGYLVALATGLGCLFSLLGVITRPKPRKRARAVKVTDRANIEKLEYLVAEFQSDLASGDDLLELWATDNDLRAHDTRDRALGFRGPIGFPEGRSIETLLTVVPTMKPARYQEIKTWWNGICEAAAAEEAKFSS